MTFVCVSATADPCRYVWFTGGGFAFARIEDHRRWAIAKIWRWCWKELEVKTNNNKGEI